MAVASGWVGLCTRPFTSSVAEVWAISVTPQNYVPAGISDPARAGRRRFRVPDVPDVPDIDDLAVNEVAGHRPHSRGGPEVRPDDTVKRRGAHTQAPQQHRGQ